MGNLYLTTKIDKKLDEIANSNKVKKEALGNILLVLSLCDEKQVIQAVNLIKTWELGGGTMMENMKL